MNLALKSTPSVQDTFPFERRNLRWRITARNQSATLAYDFSDPLNTLSKKLLPCIGAPTMQTKFSGCRWFAAFSPCASLRSNDSAAGLMINFDATSSCRTRPIHGTAAPACKQHVSTSLSGIILTTEVPATWNRYLYHLHVEQNRCWHFNEVGLTNSLKHMIHS